VILGWLTALTAGWSASAAQDQPEFLSSPEASELGLPFSEAVRAGELLFLSGQIGTKEGSLEIVPGGIQAQARQTLNNIKSVLERYGYSMSQVVKCTVFLADIAEWPAFNEVYKEFFRAPYPARSALAASGLALNARVELECIAYAPRASEPARSQ
jgi:reactive intermediate/imine deaminase